MKMICAAVALFMLASVSAFAQDSNGSTSSTSILLEPTFNFSCKETAYFTLDDGTELKGHLKKVKRRRGLVKAVKMKDEQGKRNRLKAAFIQQMYLPKSKYAPVIKTTNLTNCDSELNRQLLADGYTYFEQANLQIRKKSKGQLLQLLNPGESAKVKVYLNPKTKAYYRIGYGSANYAKAPKSYFVQKDKDETAQLLKKGKYKKQSKEFWPAGTDSKANWKDLQKHIAAYNNI
jgi:hypothetical protein